MKLGIQLVNVEYLHMKYSFLTESAKLFKVGPMFEFSIDTSNT